MLEQFKNIYEVRKSLRFELLPIQIQNLTFFEQNEVFDISFLIELLNFKNKLVNLQQTNGGKKLQDNIDKKVLSDWLEEAFNRIQKYILNQIYLKTSFEEIPAKRKEGYSKNVKNFLNIKIEDVPSESFETPKESQVFNSIKLISSLIVENNLTNDDKLLEKLKKIKNFNPNWEGFYDVFTLNPYTANRKKKEEIEKNYLILLKQKNEKEENAINLINIIKTEFSSKIQELKEGLNKKGKENKTLNYFSWIFFKYKLENYDDIYFLQNKINGFLGLKNAKNIKDENIKKEVEKLYNNNNIKQKVNDLKQTIAEIKKDISTIDGYKINLLENFSTKGKYSFLIKQNDYYFLIEKDFEKLSDFLDFFEKLENGSSKAIWIDSITWGGFDKLFLSTISDISFEDGTNIKDFEEYKNIIDLKEKRKELQLGKKEEIKKQKKRIIDEIKKGENKELIEEFTNFLKSLGIEKVNFFIKKGKKEKFNYSKELNDFVNELPEIKEYDEKEIENKLLENIMNLLNKIKDKKYIVGTEKKDLSFLGNMPEFNSIEELKNYFNDKGYSVKTKNVDLEHLFELAESGEIKIYQIKNKDLPYHEKFVNSQVCGNLDTALNNKKLESNKKDLFTLYWESFWEDIEKGNDFVRLGADFRLRSLASSGDNKNFWKKEKNIARYSGRKEEINNFVVRYKRDRNYIDFNLNLNATSHGDLEKVNQAINDNLKNKLDNNGKITILSLDHGESNFLTFKVFDFYSNGKIEERKDLEPASSFDDWKLNTPTNDINKKQETINCGKDCSVKHQIDNYITRYKTITEEKKRERQVQEALKEFSHDLLKKLKQIVSDDKLPNDKLDIDKKTISKTFDLIDYVINTYDKRKGLKGFKKDLQKLNIFNKLDKFKFNYCKYNFEKVIPDQKNLKEIIDNYISGLQDFLKDKSKLKKLLIYIKSNFGKLENEEKLYENYKIFDYKKYLKNSLANINNFKRGYASVIVGYIAELLKEGRIDLISVENNLISYGIDNSKETSKWMGTANHPTFIQALINKLSFVMDKKTKQTYQFCFYTKTKDTKKLKNEQNGVIVFVDESETSLFCPKCEDKKLVRKKFNGEDYLHHLSFEDCKKFTKEKEKKVCLEKVGNKINGEICNFKINKSEGKFEEFNGIKFYNGDDLATYNIAKESFKYIKGKIEELNNLNGLQNSLKEWNNETHNNLFE